MSSFLAQEWNYDITTKILTNRHLEDSKIFLNGNVANNLMWQYQRSKWNWIPAGIDLCNRATFYIRRENDEDTDG